MRTVSALLLALAALCLGASPLAAQSTLDEQIDAAIAGGINYIWSQQQPSGLFSDLDPQNIPDTVRYPGDRTIMFVTVLAYAGVDPVKEPRLQKAIKAMLELELAKTYTLSLRVIGLAELYRGADVKRKPGYRQAMRQDVDKLVDIQHSHGGWDYQKGTNEESWDFSNTQLAVLALREAVLCGIEVDPEVFKRSRQLYLEKHLADGGWNYGRPGLRWANVPSYGSMTAAAVASLFIIRDTLNPGQGCPCRGGRSGGRYDPEVRNAIRDGVNWLAENFIPSENPGPGPRVTYYWLYAAERVGIHTGFKYFGLHNWYREGAQFILSHGGGGHWGSFSDTAFALLFLIKGRGPILMNKLRYDGNWDLHPYDAAKLAEYVGKIKEQHMNWQVIHLDIPVEEMHDAPILYITAEEAVEFSDEHKKKLREFTETGGSLLLEASCGNRAADDWWRKLCQEIWPEWELKVLSKEHPLWTADLDIGARPPLMYGLSDGIRTFVFYSPRDISCKWHMMAVSRDEPLFQLGNNLYAYTTDRGKLRARLAEREIGAGEKYAGQSPFYRGSQNRLTLARLTHGGTWHVNRHYHPWQLVAEDVKDRTGLEVSEGDPVTAGQAIPPEVDLVYLGGRGRPDLGEEAVKQLKAWLAGKGLLFAEATAGDQLFDESFRKLMATAGLDLRELKGDHPVVTGALEGGAGGFAITRADYTFALRPDRIGKPDPLLFGIYDRERLVGVYSPFDIMFSQTGCKAFGSRGYASDDARALAINVVLLAAGRKDSAAPPAQE